jgi:N6-L-threonylcarbamoyladenine synthase
MKKNYLILAFDTSCDETSAALTSDDRVLSNIISSQEAIHKKHGGVVPNLAKREHQKMIDPVINRALEKSMVNGQWSNVDCLAITLGPGLAPALEVGIAKIKQLARKFKKPVIAVNHMEGHLLSSFAKNSQGNGPFSKIMPQFPILGLLVSGGHTQLVLMKKIGSYQLVGETLDDAAGEAFDKVAKMLGLGYPGGPVLSEFAKKGKPIYDLPVPMKNFKDLNFSFSGLKTSCLYKLEKLKKKGKKFDKQFYYDFSASFEKAATDSLQIKLDLAIKKYSPKQIILGGGVINNLTLRKKARATCKKYGLKLFFPYSKKLFTDNAAMIGVCAWYQAKRGDFVKNIKKLDRKPNLCF